MISKVSISVLNSGVKVAAEFDIGIEKYGTITCLSKETKELLTNEKFDCTSDGSDKNRGFISDDGIITFVLKIKMTENAGNNALNMQPKEPGVHVKLAEKFSETCINTDAPPDPLVDVTLHVEGKKIYGHKIILSLASKYFDRMFASNMKESNTKDVYLENIGFATLKLLVEFLYSDSINEDEITLELMEAADRFE